ncbi:MAG: glycosyltransferase family 2 protein [Anaerolineae bacterium]|nr:glycosyltransferase family 2 protein [Anaerolineae bacterium]MDW8099849.1 glycosyltransferase family 2 protein [Anaerolineae bacterium]
MGGVFPLCVVIPNWNLPAETIECVASVLAAAGNDDVSVVVVDNGSTDGSPEALASAFGELVAQVQMGWNRGFAGAVNAGVLYALEQGAASVLVLNNDTVIDQEMLAILNRVAKEHPDAGILAPAIYRVDAPTRLWRLGDRHHRWLPMPRRIPDHEVAAEVVEADYVTGCGMLIRREVIEAIGLFDERFFMYYEDADFCKRARARGFRILCVPAAKMWHRVSATARRDMATNLYWRARGQVLFYRKHVGCDISWLPHFFVAGKVMLMALRYSLQGRWTCSRSVIQGALDGYRISLRQEG